LAPGERRRGEWPWKVGCREGGSSGDDVLKPF